MNLFEAIKIAAKAPDAAGSRSYLKRLSWPDGHWLKWSSEKQLFVGKDGESTWLIEFNDIFAKDWEAFDKFIPKENEK